MRAHAGRRRLAGCTALVVGLAEATVHGAPATEPRRDYEGPAAIDASDDPVPEPVPPVTRLPIEGPVPASVDDPAAEQSEPAREGEVGSPPPVGPGPPTGASTSTTVWRPKHRLVYRSFAALRANPIGAVEELTIGYRRQLVDRDEELWRDTFLLLGLHTFFTPAFMRFGPTVEIQPAAVLNLSATYDFVGMFGAFGQLQSLRTPTVPFGPDDVFRDPDDANFYATWGHLVTLSALLQAKVKRVAVRNTTKGYWSKMQLRRGDTVFFDMALDILHPNGGWSLTNDSDLLWLFDQGVILGVRHTLTKAFYTQDVFLPGEPVSDPNGYTSRLGPAVLWTIFDRPGTRFNRPSVVFIAQWWLRHRWRTGAHVHAAIPYAAIAFSFDGDLFPFRKAPPRPPRRIGPRRRRG